MRFRKGLAGVLAAIMAITALVSALIIPASVSLAADVADSAPAGYVSVTDDFSDIAKAVEDGVYTQDGVALKKDDANVQTIITSAGFKYENMANGVFRFRAYEGYDNNLFTNWGEHVKISMNNGASFNLTDWVLTRNEWSDASSNVVTVKGYDYVDGTTENDVELYSQEVTLEQKTNYLEMNWTGLDYIVCTVGQGVGFCDVNYEIPNPEVLAYEGFATADGLDGVGLSTAVTNGYGWANAWSAADGAWAKQHNYTIYSGSALDYAFRDEGKITKRSSQYMLGGASWIYLRRMFAVPADGSYTKATTYNTKDGDVFVPNEINAYGKPGTTLYFSTLLLSPLGDDEGRWISFERGDYKGNKNDNDGGYDGNDRIVVGAERGRQSNSIGLRYITKDAENANNFDVTYAYPENGYSIHDKQEAQLIVVKFEFKEDNTTDVSLYLNPGSEEPENADAFLTATTDVSFDRIHMDMAGAYETALDEMKLSTTWDAAVSAIDGEISTEVKPATQSNEDLLMIEETFDSYENGQLLKPITDVANQVAGGGFGWQNAEDKSRDSHKFTWSSTQNNDSVWSETLKVDDANPITYPNLITSDKYITYTGYDTGNSIETIGFGRMIDVSDASLAVQNGYVNNDTNGTRYIGGTPGGTVWMSAMMRMQTKGANEGNVITFDRGRWGFPWQADGPGLSIGVRRWSGDNKNYWNVAFGSNRIQTEKEIVAGENTLVVAKVEMNEALAGTISVWINPDLNILGEPDAKLDVRNQPIIFRQLTVTNRDFDLGAVRVGTSMASVLPLKSYKVPVTGFILNGVEVNPEDVNVSITGTNYGADGPYIALDAEAPVDYKYIKLEGTVGEQSIADFADNIILVAGDRRIDMSEFQADTSEENTLLYTMDPNALDQLVLPVAETGVGLFENPQYKTLKFVGTNGATLYYTVDGSEPDVGAETTFVYDNNGIAITPGDKLTIKMKAVADGYLDSEVFTFKYVSPADEFEGGLVDNGSFQVKKDDGNIYGWTLWGVGNNADELVVVPGSGGANETEAAKIPADYAGKTVEISAKVKVEGDLEAANDANMMIKIHAKGDADANFEPAAEPGKMFLLTKATEGISTEEYVEIKQTVTLPNAEEFADFANPYFRVEIWNNSDLTWHIDDLAVKAKAAAPVASVDAIEGATEPLSIELTAEEGAKIYYTTDGSEPTVESAEYTEAIAVNYGEAISLRAIAVMDGYITSEVFSAEYSVLAKAEKPVIAPEAGNYNVDPGTKMDVTITAEEGAKIYYTLDGSEPTTESTEYTEAIKLGAGTTTVKAIAVVDGKVTSDIAEAVFEIRELEASTTPPIGGGDPTPGPGGEDDPTPGPEGGNAKKVKKVKFAKKSVKAKKGKKFTLKVKLTPKKGLSKKAKKVKWSIDKKGKKVVKFVKPAKKLNGKLTVKVKALKKGKAKITCKAPSGKKAVCKIVVK